jgi:hypothetical protein
VIRIIIKSLTVSPTATTASSSERVRDGNSSASSQASISANSAVTFNVSAAILPTATTLAAGGYVKISGGMSEFTSTFTASGREKWEPLAADGEAWSNVLAGSQTWGTIPTSSETWTQLP